MLSVPTETTLKIAAKSIVQVTRQNNTEVRRDDIRYALVQAFGLQKAEDHLLDKVTETGGSLTQSQALHAIATACGYRTWQALKNAIQENGSGISSEPDSTADAGENDHLVRHLKWSDANTLYRVIMEQHVTAGDGDHLGRSRSMVRAFASLLQDLRDNAGVKMDRQVLRSLFDPDAVFSLAHHVNGWTWHEASDGRLEKAVHRDTAERPILTIHRERADGTISQEHLKAGNLQDALTPATLLRFSRFVHTIPGYQPDKGLRQSQMAYDQTTYLTTRLDLTF